MRELNSLGWIESRKGGLLNLLTRVLRRLYFFRLYFALLAEVFLLEISGEGRELHVMAVVI